MVILLAIPTLSASLRMGWYISLFGLTQIRLYGLLVLIVCALFIVMTALRFSFRIYQQGQLAELVILVVLLMVSSVMNLDQLIAGYTLQQSKIEAQDYLLLTDLSADSVAGWIGSYQYAVTIVQEYNNKKTTDLSNLEKEEIKQLTNELQKAKTCQQSY